MSALPLLTLTDLGKSFGHKPLFTGISMTVNKGERTALIGPNGSGKSTLLRIMAGLDDADEGSARRRGDVRAAYVAQEDTFDESLTIVEVLRQALEHAGFSSNEQDGKIEVTCGRTKFPDKQAKISTLSGGWRKRLAIARGMIIEPELLLLDEPTNHLDIAGIVWLEETLSRLNNSLVFVSHDRYLIENLARRVIEINRIYPTGYFSQNGGYADFVEGREANLTALNQQRDALANRTRREVEWLRQGAKARTTKSRYRSEQAHMLVDKLKKFNLAERKVTLEFSASQRKTRDLIKLDRISKSIGGKELFREITFTVMAGVRLGVVGYNGSGKTTFLRTLLGELKPDSGTIDSARNLRVAFFDQARKQLDPEMLLKQALCSNGDSVVFNGRQIHVAGWAERFLFTRDHLALPLKALSGGERARVLLAKLMLEETDILIFDEPTNDLDIRTLEILEESFNEYPGAIILVTHDRYLLDSIATTVLGIGPNGGLFGDFAQWQKAQASSVESLKPVKLTSEERKELDSIEKEILKAEKLVEQLHAEAASEKVIADPVSLKACCERLSAQQQRVEQLYNRWEDLEDKKKLLKS